MLHKISDSELPLSAQGRIYHLNILPEELADTVITVGDPARVASITNYFDTLEFKRQHREFIVHTGYLNKQRITVLSTGIGTANIDIVMNESYISHQSRKFL